MNNETTIPNLRSFRKLEDLNLIDNFLFQQMLINPDLADAEIIPDIYDIEPNNSYEKETLPKRTRYYHGLIDTQLLATGAGYDKLPNVIIIVILPYDPFDKNRMVYTIRNHCDEVPNLPYDDGARKIFLYTKGTQGNPSQSLKSMLKYIQESTKENVTNEDIASIEQLVNKVKYKKEVGINYMKSWEVEEMARKDGYRDGFSDATDKINQLIILLSDANRTEDILKLAKDDAYRDRLFEEFDLK